MSQRALPLRGFGYAVLFMIVWTLSSVVWRPLDQYFPWQVPDQAVGAGIPLILIGIAITLTTVGYFIFRGKGTPAIFDPPKQFVPSGLHRFVRNPMYIGYVVGLLGLGLWFQSVSMVAFAIVVFALIHAFVVLAEEPGLRKKFGDEYET